jgi:agmatine deiminase
MVQESKYVVMRFLFILNTMVLLLPLSGQTDIQTFQQRTHMLSQDELITLSQSGRGFIATPPPGGKVRSIAEFEPTEGVVIAYPGQFGIPYTLIAQMSQLTKVYTLVASASVETTVRNLYTSNGVNLNNCLFIYGTIDSYWSRDYGPWFIADSANHVAIVDFPYNRPRPNDDDAPGRVATALGLQMYGMNVKHTGGNYMTNGMGRAASSKLVGTENSSLTPAQIGAYMHDFLGIDAYDTIDDPLGEYIEHIDCWGKFLAPDKILLGQVPSSDPRYNDYEAVAAYFAATPSPYGYPFRVFRVYSPNAQPYTNSYILNKTVFLPVVTSGGTPWNDSAVAAYQRAMPGYTIQSIFGLSSKPWEATDALHCRTHEIADRGMLYIKHLPLYGNIGQKTSYEVRAELISYSGSPLYSDSVKIFYRYENGPWHFTLMTPDTGSVWRGFIPDSAANTTIQYYIHAADTSSRSENHPYIGMYDPHFFKVISTIGTENEPVDVAEMLLFPNPCDTRLFILNLHPGKSEVNIRLYDLTGKTILSSTYSDAKSLFKEGVDVYHLQNGVYLLEMTSGDQRHVKRIIVSHP